MSKLPRGLAEHVPLAPHTTFRAGGFARWFLAADDLDHLRAALACARQDGVPVFLLGGGSNVLVDDEGFPGLVILLGKGFRAIEPDPERGELTAGAGAPLPRLGRAAADRGWSDFLFLCGIPGTVGGAVRMNAGTRDGEVKDILVHADILTPDGELRRYAAEELGFGYRTSALKAMPGAVVVSARFAARRTPEDPRVIRKRLDEMIEARRAREPKNPRNFGSVFRNPPGGPPAGKLLEDAGLKGAREGGAMVAPEHANWIVNIGGATVDDAKALIARMQGEVEKRFGVRLEREVIYVP